MTTSILLIAAVGVPLAMLLACIASGLRERMPPLLALAPIPALVAALFADDTPLVLGNAQFALSFAMDEPGAMLLLVAAILWIAAGAYAATGLRGAVNAGSFVVCWLMTLTGCVGVFLAADLVGFYFLLAVLSVGASGLVLQGGAPEALRASAVYLGFALIAEAFLLAGLVMLAMATPDGSLLIRDAAAAIPASPWRDLTLALLVVGLGMKAGLVPLHFWMPLAYGAAPIPAAAVMSGAVVKASALALIRFLPFDVALPDFGLPLAAIGLFGAFYGVVIGITQSRPKIVLAYSSVSQMGFLVAVIGMGLAAGDADAPLAASFYAAHHLLVKGALFLAAGVIATTGRRRLWLMLLPAAILALGVGGLPLTGGALAKLAVKPVLGDGWVELLAILSAIGTTLLMLHFLHRLLAASAAQDASASAPIGLRFTLDADVHCRYRDSLDAVFGNRNRHLVLCAPARDTLGGAMAPFDRRGAGARTLALGAVSAIDTGRRHRGRGSTRDARCGSMGRCPGTGGRCAAAVAGGDLDALGTHAPDRRSVDRRALNLVGNSSNGPGNRRSQRD